MKNKKWILCVFLIVMILGCVLFFDGNEENIKAAEAIEVEETVLTENVVYNGATKIVKDINLNGYVLQVNGDLEIASGVKLNRGSLIVNGNILHTYGGVTVGQGIIEVSGDYRIGDKRILADGTEELVCGDGWINMGELDGFMKIGGDFISWGGRGSYFGAGQIEIGGNLEINDYVYFEKVILRGKKVHRIEVNENWNSGLGLESEGEIIWKGYMRISKMFSDLNVRSEKEGLVIGWIDVNGKNLNLMSDVKVVGDIELNGGTVNIEGQILQTNGHIKLYDGIVNIKGDVLQTGGKVSINNGVMDISGEYRIQGIRNLVDGTIQYIGSGGTINMYGESGLLKIGGDFITQSRESNINNHFSAGTMEIGGDVIQKNGHLWNFRCSDSHKVILTGEKGQKVEFESSGATFNTLVITRPLSEYTFATNPCWKTLEESATSISDCTVNSIGKESYTGKAIKPTVTITCQDKILVQDTDYTLSYANNKNTGKATVTITGIGAYTGTMEKSFQIVPAKVADLKAVSTVAKQATLTWKKDSTATGYVLEYSTDKSFKKNVSKITINKKATISREVTKLTSKKTYYFRVRAYKTIDGKKAYGTYSNVVSVQVK